ncbi:MAG: hypothetical protein ABF652_20230 [Clostridium beijerinckii]
MEINQLMAIVLAILTNIMFNRTLKDFYLGLEIIKNPFKISINISFNDKGKDT